MLRRFACAVILLLIARGGFSVAVHGLYDVELAVAAKDETSRGEALRLGLSQVLGRVIVPEAAGSKAYGVILARAADFVEEYEYLTPKDGGRGAVLRMRFDSESLRKAVQQSRIGIWGMERPEVVVWLLVQEDGEPRHVQLQESPEFDRALAAAAERRKLPVIAPLWDLTDRAHLNWNEAETGNQTRVLEATRRYDSDTALLGMLRRSGEQGWESRWRFVGLGLDAAWQAGPLELDAALQAGIDGAYSRLITLYVPVATEHAVVEVQVEGIASMGDAERCGEYLRRLPTIRRADWLKAESNVATWRLTVAGSAETLRRILAFSRALKPAAPAEGTEPTLLYRWVP